MGNMLASNRIYIGFFGRRNTGKSSVLSTVTSQDLAVALDVKGTTVDPIYKAMGLLPLGPTIMIDTPGIGDEGQLGSLRMKKSYQVFDKTDVAMLVMDVCHGPTPEDYTLLKKIGERQISCVAVCDKMDVVGAAGGRPEGIPESVPALSVSAHTDQGIATLKERLAGPGKIQETSRKIVGDLPSPSNLAVLVVPIGKAAPKGHLVLPQQQTIRGILEADTVSMVVRENGLRDTLASLGKKPGMVITDSRVPAKVSADTPKGILLTSFSILSARYKGSLKPMVRGARALDRIRKGDRILICEGYTHHRQCEDIGTVKLPGWVREYTGAEPEFVLASGTESPDDLADFRLTVHCGGCILNGREMKYGMKRVHDQGILIINHGMAIACAQGILRQNVEPFLEIAALFCDNWEG